MIRLRPPFALAAGLLVLALAASAPPAHAITGAHAAEVPQRGWWQRLIQPDAQPMPVTAPAAAEASPRQLRAQRRHVRVEQRRVQRAERLSARALAAGDRSWLMAVLLSFFLGLFGIDRFYLGYPLAGLVKLVTAGGFGLWALIDFFAILFGALKPKRGSYF